MTDSKLLDKVSAKLTKLDKQIKKVYELLNKADTLTDAVLKYDSYDTKASKATYAKWIRMVKELDKIV